MYRGIRQGTLRTARTIAEDKGTTPGGFGEPPAALLAQQSGADYREDVQPSVFITRSADKSPLANVRRP